MISTPDGETLSVPGAAAHDPTAARIWEKAGTKLVR
jgi:hypothetical protein